jgi:amino acid adenylation domain-containing protein
MVPGAVVMLEEMPLTVNGKVDRQAMPAPEYVKQEGREGGKARSAVEKIVAGIWEEVLKVEGVGVGDNFFELGGHSLLATQVISRTRKAFGIELPMRVLFEEGTVRGLAGRVEEALGKGKKREMPGLVRVSREEGLPLSYAQQRLWFLEQLEPGSSRYNVPLGLRLRGELEVEVVGKAIGEIVRRHEVLRTSFPVEEGEAVQRIGRFEGWKLEVEDVSGERAEERAEEIAREEAEKPFELWKGGQLRTRLLKLGEQDHVLLVTMHHMVSDGWSLGVMVREFVELYEAGREGREAELEELGIQYGDYAHWQREWLEGEVLEEQLEYWREQLAGVKVVDLGSDYRRRGKGEGGRAGRVEVRMGEELRREAEQFSREQGVTLFMTLVGVWQVLLWRLSGERDVAVGTGVANRVRVETEPLIGFFVNTVVLRSRIEEEGSFLEMMEQVRRVVLEAYGHQDVPFERVVEEVAPERVLGQTPLFQNLLVLQNTPQEKVELRGLEVSSWEAGGRQAKFELMVSLREEGKGLEGVLEYGAEVYGEERMRRLVEQYERLLKELVGGGGGRKLREVSLLSEEEKRRVVEEWNPWREELKGWREELKGRSVVGQFEEEAGRRGDAVAAVYEEQHLSYGELNRRGNQVGHYLRRVGVGVETAVGLCCERSLELLVGMVGILKAGGCYVPLDAGYPVERLKWMMENTGTQVLVTSQGKEGMFASGVGERLRLDEDWGTVAGESGDNLQPVTEAEHLAYVIYTSGSTGQPKGVAVQHAGILRLVLNSNYLHITPMNRIAQASSASFDAATFEIWGTLLNGASLVGFQRESILSGPELERRLREEQITTLFLTTALFQKIVRDAPGAFSSLDSLLFGGEAVDPQRVQELLTVSPPQRLLHVYGPTETTTYATWHLVRSVENQALTVPIGGAISNTTAYVLDDYKEPVPPGVVGELYIGGCGVSRGYWKEPGITAEHFVPDPFAHHGGARLYRTGDHVRWTATGALEFIGRSDNQVKIRGFRIELAEIEATLQQYPGVLQCAVVARLDHNSDKHLVAYIATRSVPRPTSNQLRRWLSQKFPEYMVPGTFCVLDELKLNTNGKVDRNALPELEHDGDDVESGAAPRTPVEEILAGIWSEVLGREGIGVYDNFFDLGGHSLLATQIISRLRTAFTIDLPLRTVFEASTLADLAQQIEGALGRRQEAEAQPIVPVPRTQVIPLSFAQERLWFLDQLEPGSPVYNMPFALTVSGALDIPAVERTFTEIVRRHEILRTSFPSSNGQARQQIHPPGPVPLTVRDLTADSDPHHAVQILASEEAQRSFDLASGPLLRVTLLRLAAEEHVLLVSMHHIVSDGWSIGVLMGEFTALYQAFLQRTPIKLPELAIQYADFACWQRKWLSGDVLDRQLEYWRQQLQDAPILRLPCDHPRPSMPSSSGATLSFNVSSDVLARLKMLSREENSTLFMTLLAAFQLLLGRYTTQKDISLGTVIANRNRIEIEPLIGFFVNTLVLRTRLEQAGSFRESLRTVRSTMLEANSYQDVPFERVVEELAPVRDLGRTPLFQVMFELQTLALEMPSLPNLRIGLLGADSPSAKFELSVLLSMRDSMLEGFLTYAAELFSKETMDRLAQHYVRLLDAATASPDCSLGLLPLLTEPERTQILNAWNAETTVAPRGSLVHERIIVLARHSPDAIAAVQDERHMSYGFLNDRSEGLAGVLRSRGVGPEMLVAIHLERSLESIMATLAVMKAGAAYVPLDPSYPRERLMYIMQDSRAKLVLTHSRIEEVLSDCTVPRLCLDSVVALTSPVIQECDLLPSNRLAYVIYTSGSTGTPKGVMVSHESLARTYEAYEQAFHLSDVAMTYLQMAAFSFDVCVSDFIRALASGGKLVICPRETVLVPDKLYELMATREVEFAEFVPAVLRELAEYAESSNLRLGFIRKLICSSDMWYGHDLQRLTRILGRGSHLINTYGLTECTIDSSWFETTGVNIHGASPVPIGHPLLGTSLYILDEEMEPVPPGVAGELFIGGLAVARGYLGQPELTAYRYIPDPFAKKVGMRLYRTGDRARALRDGSIEMIGRLDNQVKIRGVRIELAEVEAALAQHSAVGQAAAAVHGEGSAKKIVAYVGKLAKGSCDSASLRSFLMERLPLPAVPSTFVVLDELPLTTSGKIDRNALPAPAFHEADTYTPPRTALEDLLAGIWMSVLGTDRVSVHDNFFEIGGHSLLATQVVSRVRKSANVEIPLQAVFEDPTVARLAARIQRFHPPGDFLIPPLIRRSLREAVIPLSYAQQRLWFLNQLEGAKQAYNVPVVLKLRGHFDVDVLRAALNEIVRRHEILRTSFPVLDGQPHQAISPESTASMEVFNLADLPVDQRELRAQELVDRNIRSPFDLEHGPLLRVGLIVRSDCEYVLCLTVHHIASDAWSVPIFVRELSALYDCFLRGQPSPLPELPLQYADVTIWERGWLQGQELDRHLEYWRTRLEGCATTLALPTDFPRPPVQSFRGAVETFHVPADLLQGLKRLGSELGATEFMTLLATLKVWLFNHSRQNDILVGTPVSNRNQLETEGLIGFFINTLVFRTNVHESSSFADVLDQVRSNAVGAYAHQTLPFEKIVEVICPQRDASRNPLFQVMFNMDYESSARLDIPDLDIEIVNTDFLQSRFDLHMTARPLAAGLEWICVYNPDLFRPATVVSMLAALGELTRLVVDAPKVPVVGLLKKVKHMEQQKNLAQKREITQKQLQALRAPRSSAADR